MKILPLAVELFCADRRTDRKNERKEERKTEIQTGRKADRQTDMTKPVVAFRNFAKATKNHEKLVLSCQ
jgi:hypothetical protein